MAKLPEGLLPRGLDREQIAEYVSLSAGTFDKLVKNGTLPGPMKIPGTRRRVWDRAKVDRALDSLSADGSPITEKDGRAIKRLADLLE